ncbi:MAG TPA: hypothetical protein DIT49_05795 [Clostridiales bacterium]|nr:hypothetical protein [Clostridiales bacterium]
MRTHGRGRPAGFALKLKEAMGMLHQQVTVQIMLGGLSRRMGRDKALVELGGKTLLERAISRWQGYGAGIQLSVGAAERRVLAPNGIPAIPDVYPERGPLAGVHAGLRACPTPLLLVVGVDSPYHTYAQADALLEAIGTADAAVYTLEGVRQPLFGLYHQRCMSPAETLLLNGDNRMASLLDWVHTVELDTQEADTFRSLATPDDLAQAQRQADGLD